MSLLNQDKLTIGNPKSTRFLKNFHFEIHHLGIFNFCHFLSDSNSFFKKRDRTKEWPHVIPHEYT